LIKEHVDKRYGEGDVDSRMQVQLKEDESGRCGSGKHRK